MPSHRLGGHDNVLAAPVGDITAAKVIIVSDAADRGLGNEISPIAVINSHAKLLDSSNPKGFPRLQVTSVTDDQKVDPIHPRQG